MTYLLKRGRGSLRRVVHLASFDQFGEPTMQPICGHSNGLVFDTTSNVPWGLPLCLRCRGAAKRRSAS